MKIIDRIALVMFSILILILAIVTCFLVFGWVSIGPINLLVLNMLGNQTASNIAVGISVLLILLCLKCIFFSGYAKEEFGGNGILLENESGKLLISKETLVNLVNGIVRKENKVEDVSSKVILDKDNNLKVFITLFVQPNTIIKDLSVDLQNKIKEAIKKTSDLEVKEVDIRVKNIISQTEQGQLS